MLITRRSLLALPLAHALTAAPAPRPNVIVMLVDDMGFSDLGCYGSEIPTPNLDRLAAGGLRFTQFYNTARCSPSRAALLTGLYPHHAGMGHLDPYIRQGSEGYTGKLNEHCVTLGEVMRDAGYATSMTGKWHLGLENGTPPWKRGFERSLCSPFGELYFPGQTSPRIKNARLKLYDNGKDVPTDAGEVGSGWYSPDLWTKYALKYVDQAITERKPFFHYLAHNAPHFPLMAPAEDIAKFRGKYRAGWDQLRLDRHARQKKMGLVKEQWPLAERAPDSPAWNTLTAEQQDRFDHLMALYAAIVSRIDQSVGDLVEGLKQRGVLDNTLLLMMSDNGGNAESGPSGNVEGGPIGAVTSFVHLGMNWATLNNTPFRRFKHFTHEGGVATPLIAHWPKGMASSLHGKFVHQPGHLVDVMPTVLHVTGAKYPAARNGAKIYAGDGVSFAAAFQGKGWTRREPIFYFHEGNRGVRAGKWKLAMKYRGEWELYDMDADRTEQHDLAQAQPGIARKMAAQWNAWAARTNGDAWEGPARTDWGAEVGGK